MSELKAIRYSYTESVKCLVIPRLLWGKTGKGLPVEIKDYLLEMATKADERLEQQVPGGTSVIVENEWPDIAPIDTKLKKINPGGEA